MSEQIPSFALQGDDGASWSLQTEQLGLNAVDNIRKLRLQVRPRAEVDKGRLEKLLGTVLPGGPQEKVNNDADSLLAGAQ